MAVLFTSSYNNVVMVVNAKGYERLKKYMDYESRLIKEGMDPTEARAKAAHRYPHPPMISFAVHTNMPLKSDNRRYGHGGYVQLFHALEHVGNHVVHKTRFTVYNSVEWNLPVPTTEDFVKIFGRSARKLLRGD